MGDDIGLGSVTDCCLRSDFDLLNSTKLPYGENQNKPFYRFRCHHPLITQLRHNLHPEVYIGLTDLQNLGVPWQPRYPLDPTGLVCM